MCGPLPRGRTGDLVDQLGHERSWVHILTCPLGLEWTLGSWAWLWEEQNRKREGLPSSLQNQDTGSLMTEAVSFPQAAEGTSNAPGKET